MATVRTEGEFEGSTGLNVFYRAWSPPEPPRAVVVICHGFNSHSAWYEWAAEQFVGSRLAVYALDLRGRGRSEGERYYVETIAEYVDDLARMIRLAKSLRPGLAVYLLGHSAGGVVSCVYTLEHQAELAGLICESFAFQVPAPDIALAVLKGVSHIAPRAHVLQLHNKDFSRDPEVVAAMDADPFINHEVQPSGTVAAMVRADERLKKDFPLITLPVLILHGSADKATRPAGSQQFYDRAGSADKTLKLYEGHVHDLLADAGKELVMADIQSWIAGRLPRA